MEGGREGRREREGRGRERERVRERRRERERDKSILPVYDSIELKLR